MSLMLITDKTLSIKKYLGKIKPNLKNVADSLKESG